jgi:DNA-binding transcriptional LysR family regulator
MRHPMTPDQLRTFAIVAMHKNISKAALELHLSQPAISGQLRLLAESFGKVLYFRHGRGISLTPAGEQLFVYAERVRLAYEKSLALRGALNDECGGVLRIGASTTPASYLIPYLVAEFQAKFPHVQIAMRSGSTTTIIRQLGGFDIAFIEGPLIDDIPTDTVVIPWLTDQIVAIAPPTHPLARSKANISLETLAEYPLIQRETGSGMRRMIEEIFAAHDIKINVALDLANIEGVKEAVRAGMGIGFVSAMGMRHGDPTLTILPMAAETEFRRQFRILVTHHDVASHICRAFLELSTATSLPI